MIKYDNNTINDWNFGDDNIIKVYRNGALVYYKVTTSGGTPEYKVCYAVVDDISQYTDREFEDVYDKATEKWYKLNNLNKYEEYGVYGSGRTITTYEGKLTIDNGDDGEDYSTHYLTLVAQTDNVSFKYDTATSSNKLQYSLDSGSTWSDLSNGSSTTSVNSGDKVMFKASGLTVNTERGIGRITPSSSATVEGNIMSLAYGDNFSGQTTIANNYQFRKLFSGVTTITSAENMAIPATTVKQQCYSQMFHSCTNLIKTPKVIGSSAMTWSGSYCFSDMFNNCSSLASVSDNLLPALNLGTQCYWYMFQNCTALTTAPVLPALTVNTNCYQGMFAGCTSLNHITVLTTNNFTMTEWVSGVTASGTFVKNPNATWSSCGTNKYPCGWTVQDYVEPEPIKYEYQYSGGSWVNLGEVSGSSVVEYIETPSGSPYAGIELLTTPSSTSTPMYFEADYMFPTVNSDRVMPINQKSNSEIISYQMGLVMYSSPFYDYGGARLSTTYNDIGSIGSRIKIGFGVYSGDSIVEIRNLTTNTRVASTAATPKNALIPYICNAKYNTSASGDTFAEDCKIRYYGIKIYDNNVLVGNYIPAKNPSTDEYTLYETISQQYCSKIGTGTIDGSESGSTIYPVYYSEKTDPLDNLSFSSMTDANEYAYNNCVYDGMKATIDGTKYVFNSTEGWVEQSSRLPSGYTEVEYIQNTGTSYIEIDFNPNTNTRILTEMQAVSSSNYPRLFGAGAWNNASGINLAYQSDGGTKNIHINWYGRTSWSYYTSFTFDYDKHTYDLNKNYLYRDETLVGSTSYTTSYQSSDKLGVFTYIKNNRPSSSSYWGQEHFKGNMYSFKVYDNGTLVRDLVPCIKDSDSTVGAYDIVNDVFYTVPTGYTTDKLVAGNPI